LSGRPEVAATDINVRQPTSADAPALSGLLGELGYPAPPAELAQRLTALVQSGAVVYVAEVNGSVVGVITGHALHTINSTPRIAQLTALVVRESARGRGVGRRLVKEIEHWAITRGAAKISLTSALHRADAHAFYEGLGYTRSGVRLTKELRPA
jgi:GNAT superfamily N-acetyltransferase